MEGWLVSKAMYALPRTIVPEAIKKVWFSFVCWRVGHAWKLNRNDPVCSRCGKYKRDDATALARRKKRKRRWK